MKKSLLIIAAVLSFNAVQAFQNNTKYWISFVCNGKYPPYTAEPEKSIDVPICSNQIIIFKSNPPTNIVTGPKWWGDYTRAASEVGGLSFNQGKQGIPTLAKDGSQGIPLNFILI
jgi:hypothetical protein